MNAADSEVERTTLVVVVVFKQLPCFGSSMNRPQRGLDNRNRFSVLTLEASSERLQTLVSFICSTHHRGTDRCVFSLFQSPVCLGMTRSRANNVLLFAARVIICCRLFSIDLFSSHKRITRRVQCTTVWYVSFDATVSVVCTRCELSARSLRRSAAK